MKLGIMELLINKKNNQMMKMTENSQFQLSSALT